MKHLLFVMAVMGLVLGGGRSWGDDGFYVIAAGGPSGKVLKTQVFTSTSIDGSRGTGTWAKLPNFAPKTYTKLSSTSYLVITYQDSLKADVLSGSDARSMYQLRVNDLPSDAGDNAALLSMSGGGGCYGATGVWANLPKGDATLSIWHRQVDMNWCMQNFGALTTTIIVMEIEK